VNSVHQMHEASGRILAWAIPICFYEITEDEAAGPRTRRFRVLAGCPVVPRPRSHRWTGRRREGGPGKIRLGPPVAGLARRITLS